MDFFGFYDGENEIFFPDKGNAVENWGYDAYGMEAQVFQFHVYVGDMVRNSGFRVLEGEGVVLIYSGEMGRRLDGYYQL